MGPRNSSSATIPSATARSSSAPGPSAKPASAIALLTYEPNYEGSPVIAGPPGGKTHSARRPFLCQRAPAIIWRRRCCPPARNVFEELGQGFTLLAFDATDADVGAFAEAARALNVPLKVIRDGQGGGREAYETKLTLVRPDQYVVWAGNAAPTDARSLLAKAVGRA